MATLSSVSSLDWKKLERLMIFYGSKGGSMKVKTVGLFLIMVGLVLIVLAFKIGQTGQVTKTTGLIFGVIGIPWVIGCGFFITRRVKTQAEDSERRDYDQ